MTETVFFNRIERLHTNFVAFAVVLHRKHNAGSIKSVEFLYNFANR